MNDELDATLRAVVSHRREAKEVAAQEADQPNRAAIMRRAEALERFVQIGDSHDPKLASHHELLYAILWRSCRTQKLVSSITVAT